MDGFRGAEVELYPVDPGISAVYKAYRRVLKQRGNFVSWEEKIGRKPILEKIFGALVAFIGYNHASEIDYAGSVRALSSAGFERILLLPVRMCHSSLDFLMGKEPPIWLSDETIRNLQTIDEVMVSPWMWMFEGYDDGSPDIRSKYRVHENGPQVRWQIDEHRWSEICTAYQIQDIRERLSSDMGAMDWLHFDVNSNYSGRPYLSTDHTLHGNHRIGTMADVDLTR